MNVKTLFLLRAVFCSLMLSLCSIYSTSAQNWYLPETVNGPAVNAASAPVGYMEANSCCVQVIVDADPFCLDTNWDALCQSKYDGCLGDCSDPAACNYSIYATCDASFFGNQFTCSYAQWHIPEVPDVIDDGINFPPVFSCEAPAGYITPSDQCCIEHIISIDPFCLDTTWDSFCQLKFDGCSDGCLDEEACNYNQYAVCNIGIFAFLNCKFEHWYLPEDDTSGPAYFGCEPPAGYFQAEDCCVQSIVDTDPFCLNFNWDLACANAYELCLSGCDDPQACNYNVNAICNLQGCDYADWYIPELGSSDSPQLSCEPVEGFFLADPDCFGISSGFCQILPWSGSCSDSYLECKYYFGCTEPTACNYNELSVENDGTCEGMKGCTNSLTENYNPSATCDDGSCELTVLETCLGDFNGDGFVTTSDLSGFLAAFGTSCPL